MSSRRITDPDVLTLADMAGALRGDYTAGDVEWKGSPFAWIRARPSRQLGKIAEQLVERWCAAKGFEVTASPDSDADRVIGGLRVEIKSSTLWKSGVYKFQQLRDQDYEYVICLGLSPFDARCWVVAKDVIMRHAKPQHKGARGKDTFWLSFPADTPPAWLAPCGGSLAQAYKVLRDITRV